MKPYFETPTATLYLGDARDILPTLAAESVDLIVCDPPYGQDYQSGFRKVAFDKIAGDDGSLDVPATIALGLAVLKERRHIYAFGRWDMAELKVGGTTELIWDKCIIGPGDLTSVWGPSHEYITFGAKVSSKANRRDGDGQLSARLRRGSVLRYPRPNAGAVTRHPSEKPVMLLRELIESSSRFGETVLDWCMGSGSTGEAAVLEGRRFIGIELVEAYAEIAANRMLRLPVVTDSEGL